MENISDKQIKHLQNKLLHWYHLNGRKFQWRNPTASNYEKIISEVLLQRTKAQTVAQYFPTFLAAYPSWEKLWEATIEELQEILQPLGLSRQRGTRLFKLAQQLKEKAGMFPESRADLEEMSMMGQYITNAYELLILNKPAPLLDVNMARILERYFEPRKMADIRYDPDLQILAKKVVNNSRSKEINWAILDYAAIICTAIRPRCSNCSLKAQCTYYKENTFL